MYKKLAIAGTTAAVIIGAGTAALAESGSSTPPPPPPGNSSGTGPAGGAPAAPAAPGAPGAHPNHPRLNRLALDRLAKHAVHAQVVTRGKDGSFITHDLIRGQVSAVSATSITVKAADHTVQRFAVDSTTKVRLRSAGKGAPGTISQVHDGDTVVVAGVGAGPYTARHILDIEK